MSLFVRLTRRTWLASRAPPRQLEGKPVERFYSPITRDKYYGKVRRAGLGPKEYMVLKLCFGPLPWVLAVVKRVSRKKMRRLSTDSFGKQNDYCWEAFRFERVPEVDGAWASFFRRRFCGAILQFSAVVLHRRYPS